MTVVTSINKISIQLAGENALIIYFAEQTSADVSTEVSAQVQQAAQLIRQYMLHNPLQSAQQNIPTGIIDLVPSYASLMVMFDISTTDHHKVRNSLRKLLKGIENDPGNINQNSLPQPSVVELPVYYSTESGPELLNIAKVNNLTIAEVIDIHQQQEYRVYAIGFAPGFAYLGEVDERIASPRLSTPRMKVPKGAVAIADRQTAVYPSVSPGGWNIIGLCPINMFDINATPIMPVKVGDKVKFKSVNKNEYLALGGTLAALAWNETAAWNKTVIRNEKV